jgi:hypothetical protein
MIFICFFWSGPNVPGCSSFLLLTKALCYGEMGRKRVLDVAMPVSLFFPFIYLSVYSLKFLFWGAGTF